MNRNDDYKGRQCPLSACEGAGGFQPAIAAIVAHVGVDPRAVCVAAAVHRHQAPRHCLFHTRAEAEEKEGCSSRKHRYEQSWASCLFCAPTRVSPFQ